MKYVIFDKKSKMWVSYLKGMFSSDCWTTISRCANTYNALSSAIFERNWIAKVCRINRNDLIIEEVA